MRQQQQAVRAKCAEVFAKAKELYPHLSFDLVGIQFDLKGKAAGMACVRGNLFARRYHLRFNMDMLMREAAGLVINDTVPHEVAHTVCQMDPSLGRKHDYGWRRVCIALGGSGEQYHQEEVVYAKGHTYEYTSSTGQKHRISETRHKRLQASKSSWLRYRNGGGQIDHTCAFVIVGASGHTFKTAVTPIHYDGTPKFPDSLAHAKQILAPRPTSTYTIGVPEPTVIAKGTNTGANQIAPGFGKNAVIEMPTRTVTPTPTVTRTIVAPPIVGESKAATSRRIMLAGHRAGLSYETVIAQMIEACGYNRQLARGTYKANAPKIGIPVQ